MADQTVSDVAGRFELKDAIEAMGAALWHMDIGTFKGEPEAEELQRCADAAIDGLGLRD